MIAPESEDVTRGGKSVIDVNATGGGEPTTEDARAGRPSSTSAVEEASPGIDVVGSAGALVENGGAEVGSTAGAADLDSPDCDSVLGASSRRSTTGMLTSVASGASMLVVLIRPKPVDSGRFACGRKGSVVVLLAPGESIASEFGPWVANTVGRTWESGFKIPKADTVGVVVGRIVVSSPNSAKLISIVPAVMLVDRTAVLSCSNTLAGDATLASIVCVRDASDVTVVTPSLVDSVNTGVELPVFPLLGDRVIGVRLPMVPSTNGVFRSAVTLVKFSVNPSTS
jgi:hypothetical protein